MGSFWDEIGKERDRRRREQRRVEAWVRKEAAAESKRGARASASASRSSQAEEARQAREAGEAEAAERNKALEARVAASIDVLPACVALPPQTIDVLRQVEPVVEFVPPAPDPTHRRPVWTDFAPPEPGIFGQRKYERAVREARSKFDSACRELDRIQNDRIASAREDHVAKQAAVLKSHHHRWNELSEGLARRDPNAVAEFVGAVVHALSPLEGLLSGGRAVYDPEPREIVVEISLPDTDIIPTERSWRYVQTRRAVEALPSTATAVHDRGG